MNFSEVLWLGTTGATAATLAIGVSQALASARERRAEHLEQRVRDLEDRCHNLREEMARDYVRTDGMAGLRKDLRDELRDMRADLREELGGVKRASEVAEKELHERLTGISRQLERLVGSMGSRVQTGHAD